MALHALEAGANVVATARSLSQVEAAFAAVPGFSERLLPVALDVTDESQAMAAAGAAIARFGSVDVLVNNAGRGLLGAVEEASAAEVEAVFAAAIYAAVTAEQPPLRLQVGPDAVPMVEDKLTRVRDELEAWRPLASSTVFTDTDTATDNATDNADSRSA
jgi:NAD(P)-dependent dehydrogenase (short-subunit alcohol dehydrogenase family)